MSIDNPSIPIKISLSWSGGKDSAYTLYRLLQDDRYEVVNLHTTFGEESRRVGMHGIHEELIEVQAKELGLPLIKIYYPASGDNGAYEKAINHFLDILKQDDIYHIAYGDIFLEDLRKYREDQLTKKDFEAVFPLWKKDTRTLADQFINEGFKTKICAADADLIDEKWVGHDFDPKFLSALPPSVDPCGENGEFHSFCYAGPIFTNEISVLTLEKIKKSYEFKYADGTKGEKWFWFAGLELAVE